MPAMDEGGLSNLAWRRRFWFLQIIKAIRLIAGTHEGGAPHCWSPVTCGKCLKWVSCVDASFYLYSCGEKKWPKCGFSSSFLNTFSFFRARLPCYSDSPGIALIINTRSILRREVEGIQFDIRLQNCKRFWGVLS